MTKQYLQYYFHTDGTYGERSTMTDDTKWKFIVPTHNWTDSMWQVLHDAKPSERMKIASHYNVGVHDFVDDDVCEVCGFEREYTE